MDTGGTGLFVRNATGLVREVNRWDAVGLNIFYINIPLGVLLITQAPTIWPGVNITVGMLLTTLILLAPAVMYGILAATMPRAGGDYVYVSRLVHPIVGFVVGAALTLLGFLFSGVYGAWISSVGLSPTFATLGVVLKNPALTAASAQLSTRGWEFGIGVVSILIAGVLNLFGWRVVLPTMRVMMIFVLGALLIVCVLMIGTTTADFARIFSHYGSYSGVIAAAQHHGFPVGATSDAAKVFAFTALGFTVIGLFQLPAFTAGEIKSPGRGLLFGMAGGLIVAGVLIAIVAGLAYRTFGSDFLGGMTYLSANAPKQYPNLPPPFFFLYASMLTGNVPLLILVAVGFILAIFAGMFVIWLAVTRTILAFALDRVLPDWLAEVSPRFHTPVRINVVVTIGALVIMTVYVFGPTNFFGFVYSAALLQAIMFCGTSIAAILLPFRSRELFDSSPLNWRLGGVPVVTCVGVIALAEYMYFAIVLATNGAIGANAASGVVAIVVIAVITVPIYLVSYFVQRSRGVDISLAFRSLPPE